MKLRISFLTAALFVLSTLSTLASAGSSVAEKSSKWPWEIRYVLFAEEASMVLGTIAQSKKNLMSNSLLVERKKSIWAPMRFSS